ncbi:MAG TPA: peptidoglycan-associated lipoprotein Pal [Steroidobacter sp.]|uniref:peptidoglycan-associated lipoprotein Pal n=1 Tax=Steroidobacter sp. TaxID=1978227 RepID=UPI002EDA3643
MRVTQLMLIAASGLMLAACGNKPLPEAGPSSEAVGPTTSTEGASGSSVGSSPLSAEQQALAAAKAAGVIVYFDYDRAEIKPEFVPVVAAHAKYLNGNAQYKVRLEGHSDERGSREYNIGLGERRAQAVRRALMLQGVTENQITTVSYGEERPAVQGSDESAYGKNRRVELVYGR